MEKPLTYSHVIMSKTKRTTKLETQDGLPAPEHRA
jgi:hypothetical protein